MEQKKITGDGSFTLYNEEYGECYHSMVGSQTEASQKYLSPFLDYAPKTGKINLLDPFFGLGYNTFAFLEHFGLASVEAHGIEIDAELKHYWQDALNYYPKLLAESKNIDALLSQNIQLIIGDSLKHITQYPPESFHLILHDAFSFHKCPELWTVDLFLNYFDLLKDGGVVLTYSSSKIVRAGFIKAGFVVKETTPIGRKQGGTIAIKSSTIMSDEKIVNDYNDVCKSPYRDIVENDLKEKRKKIIDAQLMEHKAEHQ